MYFREPIKIKTPYCSEVENIWPIIEIEKLTLDITFPCKEFFTVLETRRSARIFNKIDDKQISSLLWCCLREQSHIFDCVNRSYKPVASAGALHCINTIFIEPENGKVWLYLHDSHSKAILTATKQDINSVIEQANKILNIGGGVLMLFVVNVKLIESCYENVESLVMKDCGVILATLGLASNALGLNYSPIGSLGTSWVKNLLKLDEEVVVGVGSAILGMR